MRKNAPCKPSRDSGRGRGPLRMLAESEAGFSIVEVVVASLIVTLVAAATATALISQARYSGDERHRQQATELAQQDQERMKGMSIKALNGLNQSRVVGPYEGTSYTIASTGKFIASNGNDTCTSSTNGAAAYVLIKTVVNWTDNRRPPITLRSLITPSSGGTLVENVYDQNAAPVEGATVRIANGSNDESAVTGTDGCVIFGGSNNGTYFVIVTKSGWVTTDGADTWYTATTVTGTATAHPLDATIGNASGITATFSANNGGLTSQAAPSISFTHSQRQSGAVTVVSPASPATSISSDKNLFPFTTPYTVWAGKCLGEIPPSTTSPSYRTSMTMVPGSYTTTPVVKMPALTLLVTYAGTRQKPDSVFMKYIQTAPSSCTESWQPAIRSDAKTNAAGSLTTPGQPFAGTTDYGGVTQTGSYTMCAGYDSDGAGSQPTRYGSLTGQTLTNFTAATSKTIAITSSSSTTNPCA